MWFPAQPYLDQVVALNPRIEWAHAQLGLGQLQAKDLVAARASFNRAIQLKPDAYQRYYYLGMSYVVEHRWRAAATSIAESLRINPEFGKGYLDLARVEVELGNYDKSKESLNRAAQVGVDRNEIAKVESWTHDRQRRN